VRGGKVARANNTLALAQIRGAMRELEFKDPLLWIGAPTARLLLGRLGEAFSVYDCADDLEKLQAPMYLQKAEERIMDEVDLVIACSDALREARADHRAPVVTIRNGVDPDHFAQARRSGPIPKLLRAMQAPIVGYHGTIYDRIDWTLVEAVCQSEPTWTFPFIGRIVQKAPESVRKLSNVHFLGEVPFEEVPDHYRAWSAGWIPHRVTELTDRQSSLKLYEYLAAGLPTVTTEIAIDPEISGMFSVARPRQDVVALLRSELKADSESRKRARMNAVLSASWSNRLESAHEHIRSLIK
jgi:glycosyltransferase involved in cell wall biosynthesis